MKFGLRCFTCGTGFDPTDTHAEIWCDGENVVTLCPTCTVASDLRIDLRKRTGNGQPSHSNEGNRHRSESSPGHDSSGETFIWDALKRMQERADEYRFRRRNRH